MLALTLSGCTHVVMDPTDETKVFGKCYLGVGIEVCQVAQPDHTAVVSGAGILPTIATAGLFGALK